MTSGAQVSEDPPKVPAQLQLRVTAGPCEGQELSAAGEELTVGRTRASSVHLKDPTVSEKHAEFRWMGEAWTLRDLGSSNGTAVNGNALEREGEGVELKNGDMIRFGTDSKVEVQIKPVLYDELTIEQILSMECARKEQEIRARVEQLVNESEQQWQATKHRLLTAHLPEP